MASSPITSWKTDGEVMETETGFIFLSSKITADGACSHEIKRRLLLGRKAMTNLVSTLKSRDITLPTKVCLVKAMFFSCTHVWMSELDYKESWEAKNWCFWTVVLEKTLESPLDCKESWIFIGRTDAEAETSILWPPDEKSWLIWKEPDAGKDWRQEEKKMTEDGWGGWMASLTRWTWVWVDSGSWWWTGSPGVLWFMGSQRVGHDWSTELNWNSRMWLWICEGMETQWLTSMRENVS